MLHFLWEGNRSHRCLFEDPSLRARYLEANADSLLVAALR